MPSLEGAQVIPPSMDLNTPGTTPAYSVEGKRGSMTSALTVWPDSPSRVAHVAPPSVLLYAPPLRVETYTVAVSVGSMAMAVGMLAPVTLNPVTRHLAPPSTLLYTETKEPFQVPA